MLCLCNTVAEYTAEQYAGAECTIFCKPNVILPKLNYCHFRSGFTSVAVPKPATADQSLERSLKRLDNDVRRTGRISRRDIEEVLEEIRAHRSATSSQSLLVIRCCGK